MSTRTYAPRAAAPRPITDKQEALIARLAGERVLSVEDQVLADARADLSTRAASQLIDRLFTAPRVGVVSVEPGYYMNATGEAYRVVPNQEGTRTYAKRLTFHEGERPSWDYAPGAVSALGALTPMTGEDAARLGLASGYCIRCCAELGGESLSARCSALIGYGETCAKREGWDYPKGVAAQRALLAEFAA